MSQFCGRYFWTDFLHDVVLFLGVEMTTLETVFWGSVFVEFFADDRPFLMGVIKSEISYSPVCGLEVGSVKVKA